MFIHPEVRHQFTFEMCRIAKTRPSMDSDTASEMAHSKLWAENLASTNQLLKSLVMCPGLLNPVEEYERQIQMEEVLDEVLDEEEDF